MYPRLIIVGVVSVATLSGCKHRDSFTEFGGLNASVQTVRPIEAQDRIDPLTRLENFLFGERDAVAISGVDDDGIEYVDPVTPSYKTASTAEVRHIVHGRGDLISDEGAIEPLPAYTLDTGDRIRIFVFDQPNLSRVYNVDDQGRIAVPLIGSVLARGRTTRALERSIKRRLQVKFVKDAKVSAEVAVYRPFFIHGEVRTPGQFPYVYGMTVEAAIATAGGFSPRAKKRDIKVVRSVDGNRSALILDPSAFVRPGDVISVDERFF